MGVAGDKLLRESIGKIVAVYYNDTSHSVSFNIGKFLGLDKNTIKLQGEDREEPIYIPRNKCIRIEVNGKLKHLPKPGEKEPKKKPLATAVTAGGESK